MVKNSFVEKTFIVGTYLNCLKEAIQKCTYNIMKQLQCVPSPYVTENKEETIWKFTFSKYQVNCLYLF